MVLAWFLACWEHARPGCDEFCGPELQVYVDDIMSTNPFEGEAFLALEGRFAGGEELWDVPQAHVAAKTTRVYYSILYSYSRSSM